MSKKNNKSKNLHAWQKFLKYAYDNDGIVSIQDCIDHKLVKDKKAFYNMLYILHNVKDLITYYFTDTGICEITFCNNGYYALDKIEEICNEDITQDIDQPKQNDIVITYNGNVVHSFKKSTVVKFLNFLDEIITDFTLAGI